MRRETSAGRAVPLRFIHVIFIPGLNECRVEGSERVAKREFLCGEFLQAADCHRLPKAMDPGINAETQKTQRRGFLFVYFVWLAVTVRRELAGDF